MHTKTSLFSLSLNLVPGLLCAILNSASAQTMQMVDANQLIATTYQYCDSRTCRFQPRVDEEYVVDRNGFRRLSGGREIANQSLASERDEVIGSALSARGNVLALNVRTVTMSRRGFGSAVARPDDLDRSFRVELYNPRSGSVIKSFDFGAFSVGNLSLSDDGEILFVAGTDLERGEIREVQVVNTRSGAQIGAFPYSNMRDVVLYANGLDVDGQAFAVIQSANGVQIFHSRDPFSVAEYEIGCGTGLGSLLADQPHSLGVLPFESNMNNAELLNSAVLSAFANTTLTVIERENLRAVLEEIQLSQSGITSTEIIVDIGKMLAASHLIAGNINRTGQDIVVQTRAIDTETSSVVSSCTLQCRDCLDQDLFEGATRLMETWTQ